MPATFGRSAPVLCPRRMSKLIKRQRTCTGIALRHLKSSQRNRNRRSKWHIVVYREQLAAEVGQSELWSYLLSQRDTCPRVLDAGSSVRYRRTGIICADPSSSVTFLRIVFRRTLTEFLRTRLTSQGCGSGQFSCLCRKRNVSTAWISWTPLNHSMAVRSGIPRNA
jgi:hypothetical protein